MPEPFFLATGTRHYAREETVRRRPRAVPAFVPIEGQRVRADCEPPVVGTVRSIDRHRGTARVQVGNRLVPFWFGELQEERE